MLHMSYVDFLVCKRCFRCWLCDFLFSRQNGAERKQRPIFTFFRRRLAVTLQGIVCCCWVIRYLENPRAN